MEKSVDPDQLASGTVWILISWLLQKPADLDLHCLLGINIWFHTVFLKNLYNLAAQ